MKPKKITFVFTILFIIEVKCLKRYSLSCSSRGFDVENMYQSLGSVNLTKFRQNYQGITFSSKKINLKENIREISYLSSLLGQLKNDNCKSQIYNFIMELQKNTFWAVQMFDASAKFPSGLVTANTYQFGNYDQCISVSSKNYAIKGKYCLAQVQFSPLKNKYPPFYNLNMENEYSLHYDPYKSVLEKFRVSKDFTKKRRDIFETGICIPDSCTARDANIILNNIVLPKVIHLRYNFTIKIPENACTSRVKSMSLEAKILGYTIGIIVIFVLWCTLWDCIYKRNDKSDKFSSYIGTFSLAKNLSNISVDTGDGDLNIFNGMKSLSMVLVILGHRCLASCGGPFFNPMFLEERYRKIQNILLLNGTLIVDTFFLIGGFLTFVSLFKEFNKSKKLNLPQIYLYRWLRLTPAYMIMIFFYGNILEHLGDGPYWAIKIEREAERCRQNWWTNFFFINNYVNSESLCMFQSWYVACDMHFSLLAPILVQIIARSPKKRLLFLFLIISSLLILFFVTYYNKYDGVLRVYITTLEDLTTNFTFNKVYIKSHNRATPYFTGMAAAYTYMKLKKAHYKFSLVQVWIFSVLAVIFAFIAICGAWLFYIPGREYNALENALYASLHRLFWGISMSWIAVAGGTKAFGIIEPILSQNFFVPLSKLSYSAFLVHGAIQLYTSASLRTPEYMSFVKLYWMTCGDVILSYFFGLLLYLFFEAPMKGIQKQLFSKK